ncbi:MAG: FemAB family XrtA/PEP-CTERM system-associated protein [Candidatus Brocadiales bacterium]
MNLKEISLDWKEREAWDYYVKNSPSGSVFHLYHWKNVIRESYGHTPYYLAVKKNENIVGILPLYLVEVPFFGFSLVSAPYLDYAGICAEREDVCNTLLEKAVELSREKGVKLLNLRELNEEKWPELVTNLDKVTMELELDSESDKVWKKIPSERRNRIRKAEKAGLHVEVHGAERLEDFYCIYSTNMRDLGSPAHSLLFFQKVFQYFPESAQLFLVFDGKKVVGAAVCLKFKKTMTIPWVSSLRNYFHLYPNNVLYWEAMKFGCHNGYQILDFGRSTIGSGTFEFKRRWGCQVKQIYWNYIMFNGCRAPGADPQKMWYAGLATRAWQNLPLPLANTLGPFLRRYISN